MQPSRIFTNAELEALAERRRGTRGDPTGIYHARVKPKIVELLGWFKEREALRKLVGKQKREI